MNTTAIEHNIITNYKNLFPLKQLSDKNVGSICGFNYRKGFVSGFVGETGEIQRGRSAVSIIDGSVQIQKKPFFYSNVRTLNGINKMLQGVIANVNNPKVVQKNVLNIRRFM